MKYQDTQKQIRIGRAKAMSKLWHSGVTLREIAERHQPPISKQRVAVLIASLNK